MRVHTKLEYRLNFGDYVLIHEEGFEYFGPVAFCKGDDTAQASEKASAAFNTELQGYMQTQFAQSQESLKYLTSKSMAMIDNPTGMSADALAAARTLSTDQNASAYQNAKRQLQNNQAIKSGDLPSGVDAQIQGSLASEEAANQAGSQSQITLQNEQLKQQNRQNAINTLSGVSNTGGSYMSTLSSGANSAAGEVGNLSQANTAAAGPTFGAILGGVVGAGVQGLTSAYCPVEGSMYLMADGTERPVETLVVGDQIMGIDDEPQTIEEIQSGYAEFIEVLTANGLVTKNSYSHTYALPKGGFTVASRSLGKNISTADGPSEVISVTPAGKAWVFNIITDGSHTYRADGVWALGVGDDERRVGMNEWAGVGTRLKREMEDACQHTLVN
jgi:hypothetical protein